MWLGNFKRAYRNFMMQKQILDHYSEIDLLDIKDHEVTLQAA